MSQERSSGQSLSREDKIRRLIEAGEIFDEQDGEYAIQEDDDAEFLKGINREEYLAKIDEVLSNPEIAPDERWDLNFHKAVVGSAETPDELQYLAYEMMRDLPFAKPVDENERRRQESTRWRLEQKAMGMAVRIGRERAAEIFKRYRQTLQELFDR